MDFVEPLPDLSVDLVAGRGHYEALMEALGSARRSVWIATANLKELMVEDARAMPGRRRGGRHRYRSVLEVLAELATAGVELRILHASPPSRAFRDRFDSLEPLVKGGLELRQCPRVHFKTVLVDGRLVYLGSANWTGAGLGAKGSGRRNFEIGFLTGDDRVLDAVQEMYERVWRGGPCRDCRLRDVCEMPLDQL